MKKRLIIFLFSIFFICNNSKGQEKLYSHNFLSVANYSNQAELALCYNQLEEAESFYDSLFSIASEPSGRDVWNRALLAKQMGNKTLKDSMLILLFNKGYGLDKIGKCFDTLKLKSLASPEYLKIKSQHDSFFEKIMRDDQRVNRDKRINPDEWLETWLLNIEKIMDYVNEVDSLKIPYFTLESASQISILHYFQLWGNSKAMSKEKFARYNPHMIGLTKIDFENNGLVEFLIEQVERGHYSKNNLAYNLSISKYPFSYNVAHQYDSLVFVIEPYMLKNTGELDSINYWRSHLGVGSYEQYYTKVRFIDSLRNGEVFKPIDRKNIEEYFEQLSNNCSYKLVGNYRNVMFMKKAGSAEKGILKLKNKYGVK